MEKAKENELKELLSLDGAKGLGLLELDNFPITGRGIKTLCSFEKDEIIFTIPNTSFWTKHGAFADSKIGDMLISAKSELSEENILAIYLLFVKSRDEEEYKKKQKHISLIPTSYQNSLFFSDDELEDCRGSWLYTMTQELKKQIKSDYHELQEKLFCEAPDLFPKKVFTLDNFMWAICTFRSRAMTFLTSTNENLYCIVPYADMLNHSSDVEVSHFYDHNELKILAGKDYEEGEQVFINYGKKSNSELFLLYGFVLPNNQQDFFELVFHTSELAELYTEKLSFFKLAGLEPVTSFLLKINDPLPLNMLNYLRIQRLNYSEILKFEEKKFNTENNMVSIRNETEVLKALIESLQDILDEFSASFEVLKVKIDYDLYTENSRPWIVAQVSIGEQKILVSSLQKAKNMLESINENKD